MTRGWDKGNSWARWEGSIWQSEELGGVWGLGWVSATDKPQVKFYKKLCTVWAEFQGLSVCVGRKVPSVRASTSRDACHVLAWARRTPWEKCLVKRRWAVLMSEALLASMFCLMAWTPCKEEGNLFEWGHIPYGWPKIQTSVLFFAIQLVYFFCFMWAP